MPRGSRIAPIPFVEQSPFEQRIRALCEATGLLPAQLGTSAGLSYDAVARWISEARSGKRLPGTYANRAQLAEFCRVSVEWLNGSEPLAPGSTPPIGGSVPTVTDTLALASEAADMLTRLDGVSPAKAWSLMREVKLEAPSVLAYYEYARRKLENK